MKTFLRNFIQRFLKIRSSTQKLYCRKILLKYCKTSIKYKRTMYTRGFSGTVIHRVTFAGQLVNSSEEHGIVLV